MAKFDQESAISVIELHQLVADWVYDLDAHGGLGVPELCTEDCDYQVGGASFRSHAAVRQFYVNRNERVRTQQKDGVRTQRHTTTNLRVAFEDKNDAAIHFTLVNYSSEGKPPIRDLTGPSIIADCHFKCRREADGHWRIAQFTSEPVFVGNDPFLNASVVKT